MWAIYAFISAFSETGKDVLGKSSATKTNVLLTAFSVQFFGLLLLVPLLILTGIPHIKPNFWLGLFLAAFTIPSSQILYFQAIKLSPLSISVPILAFNPIFTALLSWFFDKRLPDTLGWLGIIFICSGLYLSRLDKEALRKEIWSPLRSIFQDPGSLSMLGVAFIWSLGAHVSKMTVVASSPVMAAVSFGTLGSILLFIIGKTSGRFNIKLIFSRLKQFTLLGILNGLSDFAMNSAMAVGFTPYVISIKRSNIIWSSIFGKILYQEPLPKIKITGIVLMFLGIIFLLV